MINLQESIGLLLILVSCVAHSADLVLELICVSEVSRVTGKWKLNFSAKEVCHVGETKWKGSLEKTLHLF